MFKKSLATALLVAAVPAVASASWFLSTQAMNQGGTVTTRNGAQTVSDGSVFKSYTTSAGIPVTVAADTGFTIKSVTINGVKTNNPASPFNTTIAGSSLTDKSVSAVFATTNQPVTATNAYGTVTPASVGNIYYGYQLKDKLVFTFSPAYGYKITAINGATGATVAGLNVVNGRVTVTYPAGYTITAPIALSAVASNTVADLNPVLPQTIVKGNGATLAVTANDQLTGATFQWTYVSGPLNTKVGQGGTQGTVKGDAGLVSTTDVTPGPTVTLATPTAASTSASGFTAAGQYKFLVTATANGQSYVKMAVINVVDSVLTGSYNTCQVCHTANHIGSPTLYSNWSTSKHSKNIGTSCGACHVGTETGGHPGPRVTSDKCKSCHPAPANHAPATLVDCLPCHNPHNPAIKPGSVSLRATTTPDAYEAGQSTPGVSSAAGYVGAPACQSCHAEQYSGWSKTSHNKPLKSIAGLGETIFKNDSNNNGQDDFKDGLDFNTATLTNKLGGSYASPWAAKGANAPKLSYETGKYYITIGAVKYEIFRTQGGNGKWKQRFHTKIGNAYYVLPVQYNELNGSYEDYNGGNWYNGANPWITAGTSNSDAATIAQVSSLLLAKNISGGATGSAAKGPSTASWDNRCAACHQTGVAIEYKSVDGASPMEVVASSADLNIGCESCHGPGEEHVNAPTKTNIKQPAGFATNVGAANYYRANEVCGQCHSRTEGFGHFSSASGKLYAGIEAPSPEIHDEGYGKVKAGSYNVGQKLLQFIEQTIPATFKLNGTSGNDGKIAYDDVPATASNAMLNFQAPDKHHQQWHDMELGKHGARTQMVSDNKLSCFSCHDAHNPNSGNIRASINGVATSAEDNSLCLACHAGLTVGTKDKFAALTTADINTSAEQDAVFEHLKAVAGYTDAAKDSWRAKYMLSVQQSGASATFGRAVYKVGQCISCHMPFTSKSGIYTSTNTTRKQGDIRSHTMKPVWPKLSGNGLTNANVVTSCSACHTIPNN